MSFHADVVNGQHTYVTRQNVTGGHWSVGTASERHRITILKWHGTAAPIIGRLEQRVAHYQRHHHEYNTVVGVYHATTYPVTSPCASYHATSTGIPSS